MRHFDTPGGNKITQDGSKATEPHGRSKTPKLSIREELRTWAAGSEAPEVTNRPLDVALATRVNNNFTRSSSQIFALDEGGSEAIDLGADFGAGPDEGIAIVGAHDRQVGDLVELT